MIIYTRKKQKILIDEEDFDKIKNFTWCVTGGYARSRYPRDKNNKQKQINMHRLIMNVTDPKIQIDHINMNKLDNRKQNLRTCNQSQNQANTLAAKRNKTGFKGVRFKTGKYEAVIWKDKQIYLGRYNTAQEAAKVYNKKAKELFGEFANLNKF